MPVAFDRDGDVEAQLRDAAPDLVVDASGPFQAYGDAYRVVRACLALGIDYLDLADGSAFVKGIAQFDAEAKARGVFILSGVSSFPVLTAAVVRHLSAGMTRVDTVTGGIAPSPYAGVGLNVIRAIASYAGKPIETGPGGRRYAMIDARRYTIAPPGRLPLDPIRFSLVDVPDLQALPELWPSLKSVWMGAGPVPEILHRALNLLAWTVRLRLLPSLVPFAPLMHGAINVLRWGEHRGGMFVAVEGAGPDGASIERSWHMTAEGDDGPFIPSMAAEAIVRRQPRWPAAAARRADGGQRTGARRLSGAVRAAPDRHAVSGTRCRRTRRFIGGCWARPGPRCPSPVRAMHELTGTLAASGLATVERGAGLLSRLVAAVMGFPPRGETCRSASIFAARAAVKSGAAISPARRSSARRKRAGAGSSGCCASGSGRLRLGSRWCSTRANCGWWCGGGRRSACRCRLRSLRAARRSKAPTTAGSISMSRSACR